MLALLLTLQSAKNYGMTQVQIDAMGADRWLIHCEMREGRPLPEYELRAQVYQAAEATKAMNKLRIAKLPVSVRPYYTLLATELETYSVKIVQAEEAVASGGTLYILLYSGSQARAAEAIKALVTKNFKSKKPYVVSDVLRELSSLDAKVKAADPDFARVDTAKTAMVDARACYTRITKLLAKRPRAESDFVLEFLVSRTVFQMSE